MDDPTGQISVKNDRGIRIGSGRPIRPPLGLTADHVFLREK